MFAVDERRSLGSLGFEEVRSARVGKLIELDLRPYVIIGVVEPGFRALIPDDAERNDPRGRLRGHLVNGFVIRRATNDLRNLGYLFQ